MANGYFERGEVYWVKMGSGLGSEMNVTRPGLIISSNSMNNTGDTVLVAFLTTREHRIEWNKTVTFATGKESWVLCDQVQTVDKARFTKHLGTLSFSEMRSVDDCLEEVFDLGYADTEALAKKDAEIEELKAKIAELTGEVAREQAKIIGLKAKHDEDLLSYRVENDMWQKCYDKALSQLVDMKCMNDLFIRGHLSAEPKLPEVPDLPRKPVEPEVPVIIPKNPPVEQPKDDRVDINHCTQTQLKKVGFSDTLARAVVAKRPWNSVSDLRNMQGMNKKKFQIFEPKLCCTPMEIIEIPEEPVAENTEVTNGGKEDKKVVWDGVKVNINSDIGVMELMKRTGMNQRTASDIVRHREQFGDYEKLEDLLNLKHFGNTVMRRYGHMLEV